MLTVQYRFKKGRTLGKWATLDTALAVVTARLAVMRLGWV